LLEQQAVHMTEEEIEAYYSRQREENLKRYYTLQAKREMREDRGRLAHLIFLTVAALAVCTIFLKLNFQVQQQTYRLSVLQKEIEALRLSNDDAEKRLEESVDLYAIREKAESYGMVYPAQGHVVYYTLEDSDYMYQTGEIPES
jgi:cell division protein FtsL